MDLIVGLDGIDYDFFKDRYGDEWNGLKLSKMIPAEEYPYTPNEWTSLVTSLPPEKHGVNDLLERGGMDRRTDIQYRRYRLWEEARRLSASVGVFGVPVITYPSYPEPELEKILIEEDWIVSGYSVVPYECYPAKLNKHLTIPPNADTHDPRNPLPRFEEMPGIDEYEERLGILISFLREAIDKIFKSVIDIYSNYPTDILFVYEHPTDIAGHYAMGNRDDLLREIYEHTFNKIDMLIDIFKPDNTLILSDHGMHPYEEKKTSIGPYTFRVSESYYYFSASHENREPGIILSNMINRDEVDITDVFSMLFRHLNANQVYDNKDRDKIENRLEQFGYW